LLSVITVLYEYVSSDHKLLSICFNNILSQVSNCHPDNNVGFIIRPAWSKASQNQLMDYSSDIDCLLSEVEIPSCLICCNAGICTDEVHCDEIIKYYEKLTACINLAIKHCIPAEQCKTNDFFVPGWTDDVQEKHNLSRQAFIDWVSAGKPRQGHAVIGMRKTRAAFKLAIRYCRQREDQIRADLCLCKQFRIKRSKKIFKQHL
jgi:hypothetical protein